MSVVQHPNSTKKPKILLIVGHAGSGKDTLADEFIKLSSQTVMKKHVADTLKMVTCEILNACYNTNVFTIKVLNDVTKKDKDIPQFKFNNKPLKIRNILQYFGTDVFRNKVPNLWVDTLIDNILMESKDKKNINFVVSDIRYENEILTIKEKLSQKFEILIVRIYRSIADNKVFSHDSESGIDNLNKYCNETFKNDNSLVELQKYAEYLAKKLNLMQMSRKQMLFEQLNGRVKNKNDILEKFFA